LGKASAPLYVAIVKTLMQRIADGVYPVGGLIPTEHELSDELAVSRQTVREAIRRLSEQGLVSRQPGVGTRVLRKTAESHYSHHMESLSELINYAFEAPLKLEQVDLISANRDQAKFLECRVRTPWLWARGHRRRPDDSELLTASDVFVRPHYPGLEDRLLSAAGPVYDLLEREYGEVISAFGAASLAMGTAWSWWGARSLPDLDSATSPPFVGKRRNCAGDRGLPRLDSAPVHS
jgi:Transcriptional regulators